MFYGDFYTGLVMDLCFWLVSKGRDKSLSGRCMCVICTVNSLV